MLNEILYPALIRLTRAFPHGHRSRPNSFGVVTSFKDIDSDNLNLTVKSGVNGSYWGRRWEASGEDRANIGFENALLFIRPETIDFPDRKEMCQNLEIGIASLPECEGCQAARTDTEIEIDNAISLRAVVSEIIEIRPYRVNIPTSLGGVGLSTYWLTPSEVEWLKVKEVSFPNLRKCDEYLSVKQTVSTYQSFDYGTAGMIVTTTKLRVCWCSDAEVGYNFATTAFKQAAYTGCETC